ncbi:MAG: hypothetical protein HFH68_01335 [Lachnospiraceae bacterium]|nr:hypothetical protein [Lachnospiraceae bacterium]
MKLIYKEVINNTECSLVLDNDGNTVNILYGNKVIDSSAGATYKNITDGDWMAPVFLRLEIGLYVNSVLMDEEFNRYVSMLD